MGKRFRKRDTLLSVRRDRFQSISISLVYSIGDCSIMIYRRILWNICRIPYRVFQFQKEGHVCFLPRNFLGNLYLIFSSLSQSL